jgi:hypothetical protein
MDMRNAAQLSGISSGENLPLPATGGDKRTMFEPLEAVTNG